ncbi:MAG: hypothetical protein IK143_00260 [Bacteroidales bacterium]|nr:hypothetical protein [Bacteroidales bacterium]
MRSPIIASPNGTASSGMTASLKMTVFEILGASSKDDALNSSPSFLTVTSHRHSWP